ncbi:MAG: adenylate/guanylate cyclase domain-containing protein [Bacteroidota bacterium]
MSRAVFANPRARFVRATVSLVAGWSVLALVAGVLATPNTTSREVIYLVFVPFGLVMGVASAWFELVALPRDGAGLSPGPVIALRTLFYSGIAAAAAVIVSILGNAVVEQRSLGAVVRDADFWAFFQGRAFVFSLAGFVVAAFLTNFVRQIRLMLGPGTLGALLVGRYRLPVPEQRAFMFLDLTGSTGLAQRLGPERFNAFKNDYFRDVVEPILATGGQIYQYVGDEVVVTWKVREGALARSPVEMFLRLDEVVHQRTPYYEAQYGEVPLYKAGLHVGDVVTAEIGELKKDIVYSGDTVNVAARIEGQCHALGARLLASREALDLAPLPEGVDPEEVGAIGLRGREGTVKLFRVVPDPLRVQTPDLLAPTTS